MIASLPETLLLAAFLAGLLSFVSPCVLPLVPSYVTYLTGLSLAELTESGRRAPLRRTILTHALLFIAGFSIVFIAFGASASAIGRVLASGQDFLRRTGAVLIVVFGLSLTGVLRLPVPATETRVAFRSRPAGSVLVGAAVAAGWTPCVGPVLGTMLLYASTTETLMDGVTLLAFYSLGLGAPLLAAALAVDRLLAGSKRVRTSLRLVSAVTGVFLILFGAAIYLDRLAYVTAFFERYGIGSYLGADGS